MGLNSKKRLALFYICLLGATDMAVVAGNSDYYNGTVQHIRPVNNTRCEQSLWRRGPNPDNTSRNQDIGAVNVTSFEDKVSKQAVKKSYKTAEDTLLIQSASSKQNSLNQAAKKEVVKEVDTVLVNGTQFKQKSSGQPVQEEMERDMDSAFVSSSSFDPKTSKQSQMQDWERGHFGQATVMSGVTQNETLKVVGQVNVTVPSSSSPRETSPLQVNDTTPRQQNGIGTKNLCSSCTHSDNRGKSMLWLNILHSKVPKRNFSQYKYNLSFLGVQCKMLSMDSNTVFRNNSTSTATASGQVLQPRTYDLKDCLRTRSKMHLPATNLVMVLNNQGADKAAEHCCNFQCSVHISVPKGKTTKVLFHSISLFSCTLFSIKMRANPELTGESKFDSCRPTLELFGPFITRLVSSATDIDFEVDVKDLRKKMLFRINVFFEQDYDHLKLEGAFFSKHAGYIQTPGYDHQTRRMLQIKSWMKVDVPPGHRIMVSFLPLDMLSHFQYCVTGKIVLFVGNVSAENIRELICSKIPPKPRLYDTDVIYLHYDSHDLSIKVQGFRMLFSIHNDTAMLKKGSSGLWNCSVPYWTDFQLHFPCNLQADCVDGNDEADCPYTSDQCGVGHFRVAGSCFLYIAQTRESQQLSWKEAAKKCQLQGTRLASLSSPQKWNQVIGVLNMYGYNAVYVGLKSAPGTLPSVYRNGFQHLDETMAYFTGDVFADRTLVYHPGCLLLMKDHQIMSMSMWSCSQKRYASVLCEQPQNVRYQGLWASGDMVIKLNSTSSAQQWRQKVNYIQCPAGHMTHDFMACDPQASCWAADFNPKSCAAPLSPLPPLFVCSNGQTVPYTLLCDHQPDCIDDSDEKFCVFPQCDLLTQSRCDNGQCIVLAKVCDGTLDCFDKSDERECERDKIRIHIKKVLPPARVDFSEQGSFTLQPLNDSSDCPDTHFQCPGDGYCLPVFVRCNGVYDCPEHEDERRCETSMCPGFYRCRQSAMCLHFTHVCDGKVHCPLRDDELSCHKECPDTCICYGRAFFCSGGFFAGRFPELRFLDARGSGIALEMLINNTLLVYLSLKRCNLSFIMDVEMLNLQTLDLTDNKLNHISTSNLSKMLNLRHLYISGNPLSSVFNQDLPSQESFPRLQSLEMANVYWPKAIFHTSQIFSTLVHLNLSNNGIDHLTGDGFQNMTNLRVLDLRGNPVTYFSSNIFEGLASLDVLESDNYKLCCPAMLPSRFNVMNCRAPSDEISSCQDLLQSDIYRGFLSLFACLSLLGNVASFAFRVITDPLKSKSFNIFVANLSIADFLMGVYLSIIGLADLSYRGDYLWKDVTWRNSAVCKTAGFLSLLSSEVSILIICLITLDRFLKLRFPFSKMHFTKYSSLLATAMVWIIGVVIAGIPLLPWTSHWKFYNQNSICVPLQFTRSNFPGYHYSFGIIVVFSVLLCLLIAAGQLFIYWSVQQSTLCTDSNTSSKNDLTIARRFFTVAFSDIMCWFSLGIFGFMAKTGQPVSETVTVAFAVLALPLNSVINPLLYNINVILENQQKRNEDQLKRMLMIHTGNEITNVQSNLNKVQAMRLFNTLLKNGVLTKEGIQDILSDDKQLETTDIINIPGHSGTTIATVTE